MAKDPSQFYVTPFLMGPFPENISTLHLEYPKVTYYVLQYLTDPDAIAALLPQCYLPGKEPEVTIAFGYCEDLDFVPGGSYALASVMVSARFDGTRDHVEGNYILVMFENETWPIVTGREMLGVPKIYADIPAAAELPDNQVRCEASINGHLLLGIDLASVKKQNAIVQVAASRMINHRPWLAYKYIPCLDGPPDADYPTICKSDFKIKEFWAGKSGAIQFGSAGESEISRYSSLLTALKTLRLCQFKQAIHYKGSSELRYDLYRRLR